MPLLYDTGIRAYHLAVRLAAPFHEKAALLCKGRKATRLRLRDFQRGKERLVWFHAASLGEFEQGRPVMEKLREMEPDTKILLTFFSPSGYEVRKNYTGADYIYYLPADTRKNARRFLATVRPDAAIFIKYEFWYHFLHELHQRQIPTYLISAIFRPGQPFFKRWGSLHRKMLGFFDCLYVQDEASVRLLNSVGITRSKQTGDTRFDRVKQIASSARNIEAVERFCAGRPAVVCGSTWPPDETILTEYINRYTGAYKWILVPHEIGENHIKSLMAKCRKKITRYSQPEIPLEDCEVLVIDCIGLLSSIYRYAKIAYIGGGFGVGIHNTLEAAVYGIPVIFGPNHQKFNEAVSLLREGGAFAIHNGTELGEVLDRLLTTPAIAEAAGRQALAYVDSQLGATDIISKKLTAKGDRETNPS
ncbi:3-deoxy-D-manno-octulosonic acid transferase [Odoribacter sp. Z80]|jgi:3-deoxy-D-manno-octulosonic-acid transferase|uniref:3-deoxy-D-manno-octulosonic acid transferase n=1 Tax=Odoribacter sp. Z80 TaxID=2304575 RepID=UPI00137B4D91|nr:glycosyltransferase N-terminal domain-containing protein [Odoribacter sp. Z80]NCE71964.1 3-deoxy-D-manno-octulosonic acid transferase [Odoribacter sp. Z80]